MADEQTKQPEMEEEISLRVELHWEGLDNVPIFFCNQFLIQHVGNEFILSIGQLTPPPFLKPLTESERKNLKSVPVRTVFRVGMTPERILELIQMLQRNFKKYQDKIPSVKQ